MKRLGMLSLFVLVLLAGCGKPGGKGEVLATIGNRTITTADLDRRLAEMPPNVQTQFEGEEGRKRLLEGMLDEEAFLLAALGMDLDENLEVKGQIESAKRRVLIQAYYQREVAPYTQMTEEDMLRFYEENPDEFTRPEEAEVRQVVLSNEADAEMVRRKLLAGEPWEPIVEKYCVDLPTKNRRGVIGPVGKNASIIPLVGTSPELAGMIDTLTVGTISPPVKTAKGYHVITVERRTPETLMAFEKIRDTIRRNYSPVFAEKVRKERVSALREKYKTRIVREPGVAAAGGAEEDAERPAAKLFDLAQATTDPKDRIKYYNEIVRNYPDDPHACEAQFMIGFVYSEELHDYDQARAAFAKVRDDNRCGEDLHKNAEWMLEHMGTEPPEFQD
ncbi:MAG: peptidyl-prolyl cis-trans isomerase [Candidatus Eisenbacteria bacterium]|nr:peptidyl-prolyl cis-trans isomerase [Candidatus Eisenbacteria bacterium]